MEINSGWRTVNCSCFLMENVLIDSNIYKWKLTKINDKDIRQENLNLLSTYYTLNQW
jgi:hypothetical protein